MRRPEETVAKVLLTDWVEDEWPYLRASPLHTSVQGGGTSLLDQVFANHLAECRQLGAEIPLVLAVARPYEDEMYDHMQAVSYRGLNPASVYWLTEEITPLFGYDGSRLQGAGPSKYLQGGGFTLATMIGTGLLSILWKKGIRWLLIGSVWNLGCRVDSEFLGLLPGQPGGGVIECVDKKRHPASKVVLFPSPRDPSHTIFAHDRRLRSEEGKAFLEQARWVGAGSYWVDCAKLVQSLGMQPSLVLESGEPGAAGGVYARFKDQLVMTYARDGYLFRSFPLCDVMALLNLAPMQVPESRFQPCLGTEL